MRKLHKLLRKWVPVVAGLLGLVKTVADILSALN